MSKPLIAVFSLLLVFDKDGDGYITVAELSQVMYRLGEDVSQEDVQEMIKEAGSEEGRITFKGLANMYTDTGFVIITQIYGF